jgi:acyl-[acyl-carrier-protein]-phospholipid O-acyltransferase/long-chain-fatty-acid--[acyl-carrier-protein] ligase
MTDDLWITILGRVKRFAKIGGEMVSLTAAEDLASAVWPDCRHAVVALPDAEEGRAPGAGHRPPGRRGRRPAGPRPEHRRAELAVPRRIIKVPEIPVLGTGKTDYVAIQRMADQDAAGA